MIGYGEYEAICYESPHQHNPYPTWTDDRGQADPSPWTQQFLEVNPEPNIGRSKQRGSIVDVHRIEGPTLDPGRVLSHPSRIVAPLLIDSNQPQTFDVPGYIMAWAPNPIVQHTYGQNTIAVDDLRHTTPKQLLGYSSDALSQQELADEAALRVRRSLYGR